MKFIIFILSLLILVLSLKPCSDGNHALDQHKDEISAEHNHKNDSDDMCSMNCTCSCCGIAITYQPIQNFELGFNNQITTEMTSIYNSIYRFDFHSNIWQPPQLIS